MGIQVIARAADIMRALKSNPLGLTLGQISNKVHLPRSTVQRIVSALQEEQFIVRTVDQNGFALGPALANLVADTQQTIVDRCRPILNEIARTTGETADLSVLRNGEMIFLDQVPGSHRLRTVSFVGEVFPLTTTANGRACLASLEIEEMKSLIELELAKNSKQVDMDAFLTMIETVKETDLAYDLDEHSKGISAIGFAFDDTQGTPHAISVPVPTSRFGFVKNRIEEALLTTRQKIVSMDDVK